jgi:AcrR family transcriptional regulator
MTGDPSAARPPGRPRDEEVGPALLAAARRLVVEHGYEAVTTRMIAEAAGAGKQTLYRRWASKAELVLDAFLAHAVSGVDQPSRGDRPVGEAVAGFIARTFAALATMGAGVRGLMATAQRDAAFRSLFRARFVEPRRDALRRLLHSAIARGELPAEADVEGAVMLLFGAVWYRLLLDEQLGGPEAERLAAVVLDGLRAAPRGCS